MSPSTPRSTASPNEPKLDLTPTTEEVVADVEKSLGLADRSTFLSLLADLAEETVHLYTTDGKDIPVLVRELTGAERASLITLQAEAYQKGSLEIEKYEKQMLLAGVADPTSPKGNRRPLLNAGDEARLMQLGASKVQDLVRAIERLSGMGVVAQQRVEGNSETTPNDGSTSG